MAEMGLSRDGQTLSSVAGLGARKGLGAAPIQPDLFNDYRQQHSNKYHHQAELRSKGTEGDDKVKCRICQGLGHLAKNCKFGIK